MHFCYPEQELDCIRIFLPANESTHNGVSDSEMNWKIKVQHIKLTMSAVQFRGVDAAL